jgi:predicted O-methyltransferase YrrM
MSPSPSEKPETWSPEKIQQLAMSFQSSRILLSAFELDVFTALSGEPKPSERVAQTIGADARATDRLMNALCALDFLKKEHGLFSNSEVAEKFLVKGRKNYLGGLMHTVHLWDTWSTLTDAVKAGHQVTSEPLEKRSSEWFEAFIAAMHQRAVMASPLFVSALDLSGVKTMMDVGGGSGAYAMAFARAKEDLRVTVFDLPGVIQLTRKYVAQGGLSDRIDFTEGDYGKDDLGQGFDLVFLSAIIHSNPPDLNRNLFKKIFRALNPGGNIAVSDFMMDESRTQPVFGAIFSLNMLVGTQAGDTFTEKEIKDWMLEAGFTDCKSIQVPGPANMVMGRKPRHD